MIEEKIEELKKELWNLTFEQKKEIITFLLYLITDDFEDLKTESYEG